MVCEYDIWSDNDGRIRSTIANKPIVDDSDAPSHSASMKFE